MTNCVDNISLARTAVTAKHVCQSFVRILICRLENLDIITVSTLCSLLLHTIHTQSQSTEELIFIADNLWIHLSPTSYLFLLIAPQGLAMALAGHQCWSFIPLHTGLVLTPLAKFTDLTDCGLNAARLVFSTCPSRFATLAAQFPPILIIHQLVMPAPGRLPLIRGDAGFGPRLAPSEGTSSEPVLSVRSCGTG